MVTTLPYGSWPSSLTAKQLATGGTRLGAPLPVGEEVWWTEGIATEGGRQAIVRTAGPVGLGEEPPAETVTVLPAPFNARSRVHEYGGASWTVVPGARPEPGAEAHEELAPLVVFVNFADQRVHAMREGEQPRPLTPVGPEVGSAHGPSLRWAEPTVVTAPDGTVEVWWVCEDHTGGEDGPRTDADGAPHIERYICQVPLDGSAAEDPSALRRVTPSSRFVAHPRVSPDGTQLAWISWEHPQMPWDGTELHLAPLMHGSAGEGEILAGGADVSVLQPEWLDEERLMFLADSSGWWNPWVWSRADGSRQVLERDEEFAGPLWTLGSTWYQVLDPDRALVQHGRAATSLSVLRISTGELTALDCPLTQIGAATLREDGLLVLAGASPTQFSALHLARLDLDGPVLSPLTVLRSSRDDAPDPGLLPEGESIEVPLPDGGVVHAIVHRPRQEGFAGREGELPPFIAQVHGGPTAHVAPVLSLPVAYYTSRGLGVVVVNYGGSSGYGRAYRNRLRGQWGVVDVQDTVAVMEHLVAEGIADGDRLAIEGGSAGGWTTLACLTRTDAFAAGVSSFGVAELEAFRLDTHDFESRYIDGLVGPYPERRDLYVERAPLSHVDELEVPVLLLQGDEDRIVPPSQSELFRDALAAKGIPHAYLLFEGEQHGFRKAETIIRAIEASLSFYGQVLGFSPACVPVLELRRDGGRA
ncbi:prolyl oligopeptidase family serine peptidase [Brachybacterium saurashtrense]|uniref:S9 family peptidase n=1 Tax=Brachybacterium saurashtrense TaxID=556288 RepID=A0A345YR82_9MICO|nr:prolyl oligopeptidase family serine peptidase [Brachybacterium saurashtrense]AXK46434.1 S9 family peptidase [Brachybacterium saurashtrense]RRR24175.1 S9 family peptidase [Brachybacterium saurashtrense]